MAVKKVVVATGGDQHPRGSEKLKIETVKMQIGREIPKKKTDLIKKNEEH